jgi:hypothetical protein
MKNQIRLAVVAAMTVGGISFCTAPARGADASTSAKGDNASVSMAGPLALPSGVTVKDLGDDTDIREALGDVVSDAVKSKGFSDVVDCFVDQDSTRLGQYKQEKGDQLNPIVKKLKAEWKSKYGKEFDFSDAQSKVSFEDVKIISGEIQNPDQLVGQWPIKQSKSVTMGNNGVEIVDKSQPAVTGQDIKQTKEESFGGDVNLEKGRDVAVVQLPAAMDLPEVRASMIKEHVTGWHFDVPNNITGQQLHDNLVKHLTMIVDQEAQWPADVNTAYGLVGHHIIEAIYGIEGTSK